MFDRLVNFIKKHPYISWLLFVVINSLLGIAVNFLFTGEFYNGIWVSVFSYFTYLPFIKKQTSKKKK